MDTYLSTSRRKWGLVAFVIACAPVLVCALLSLLYQDCFPCDTLGIILLVICAILVPMSATLSIMSLRIINNTNEEHINNWSLISILLCLIEMPIWVYLVIFLFRALFYGVTI
jgi:hypothetical protein